jgi:hypothetical protein
MRHLDGTIVQLVGTKEMDLREESAQVDALFERNRDKHTRWVNGGRKGYEPRPPDGQIREMRLHIVGHAESKARLRAIRSLGVRSAYKPEELKKPFVIAKIMWTGQSEDPELRRAFALKQADAMLGGHRALYGDVPPTPLPSVAAMPLLGGRRPPPVGQSAESGETGAIDVPATPPSEPKARTEAKPDGASPPAPSVGNGPLCRFGKTKGEPLMNLSDDELDWYHGAVRKSTEDPQKARFRADNEAHLREVLAELERRNGVPDEESEGAQDDLVDRGDDADQY